MFKTLVVGLDLEPDGDRSLPIVEALTRDAPVDVDLVTVTDPMSATAADAYELERRAGEHGWGRDAWTVVRAEDPADGLLEHTARRDGGLLVLATSARRPVTATVFGSVVYDVLARTDRPVLLIGPNVPADYIAPATTLVACFDAGDPDAAEPAIGPIVDWQRTFPTTRPQLVEILDSPDDHGAALEQLDAVAARLAAAGVPSDCRVMVADDDDLQGGFARAIDGVLGPVYVTISARITDGEPHLSSVTQHLVRHAPCPVLVVPAPRPIARRDAGSRDEHVAFRDAMAVTR